MLDKAKELVIYFENTYIGSTYQMELKQHKVDPMFSLSVWNVMETILLNGNWTNNQCEGWKHRF